MVAPLAFLLFPLWASAVAAPAEACPADEAVTAEIGRLGVARARAQTGTIDVSVEDASMRIVLRARDGTILGMREVAAPGACDERAVVAAVVIATWLGEWAAQEVPAHGPVVVATAAAQPARPPPGAGLPTDLRADLAAFAFQTHDVDAGTWGMGAQASYGLGRILSLTALGEVTGERSQPLGPGQAVYRSVRLGVGIAVRRAVGRALVEGALVPEAIRLSLRGEALPNQRSTTAWSLAGDARVRVGLRLGAIVPFLYADASYALVAARLTLVNSQSHLTLSRWGFAAGLGVLFPFGPLGG